MSFIENHWGLLEFTDWWDSDTGSNHGVIRGKLGIKNPPHENTTASERVSRGIGSAQDLEFIEKRHRNHQKWLKSPAGKRYLKNRP